MIELFLLVVVLICYCVERKALHTLDDGRPVLVERRDDERRSLLARRGRTFEDEAVTCATVASVRIEKTIAAGVVKMISEGTFGGVPVLVIQPYNGTYYQEHHKDKGRLDGALSLHRSFAMKRRVFY
jgi:hypothetical protein